MSPPKLESPTVPVSVGELFDKKSILEIKAKKFADPQQLANVLKELAILSKPCAALSKECRDEGTLAVLVGQLQRTNALLWDLENKVRQLSRDQNFGPDFVSAAQQIFSRNDERARTKRAINELMNSLLIEEKNHA
jgi:hypothetical protein